MAAADSGAARGVSSRLVARRDFRGIGGLCPVSHGVMFNAHTSAVHARNYRALLGRLGQWVSAPNVQTKRAPGAARP